MTPFCWVRRRRYTRRIYFPHKYVTRDVEVYENERINLGEYSKKGLLLTDRRNISSKDGTVNWDSFFAVTNEIPIEGWQWEEDSEWVRDGLGLGDEENWNYGTDFVENDDWYSHQPSPFSFVRRRRYRRRLVFSQNWRLQPSRTRRLSNPAYSVQDEHWALVKPTFSSLFVGHPFFYLSASEATPGTRGSPGSSVVDDMTPCSVAVVVPSMPFGDDNGSNWVLADAEQIHYHHADDRSRLSPVSPASPVSPVSYRRVPPTPMVDEDMSSLRSIEL
jgi:hypothetical protein